MKTIMKLLLLLFSYCILVSISGCATRPADHVELLDKEPGKVILGIAKQQWGGLIGPEGYVGYQTWTYWAALAGDGPEFVDPHIEGGNGEPCIGTILLDREHNKVTINMKRIVSAPGYPLRTIPHPANGTYKIDEIRKAHFYEKWF